ncbi:T9SS type A sorting domain-containing protein [Pontibacter sp. JH31]|uniref:T9SS type A sorting domain-containing protein n=1 Tax=Pontibacter aquaedesilientis TaxID=2766980 RepID=A0ABR7XFW4_9BACT|nr:T9SS type A sorting domain-containing protein [Pontibacter aquaedesilientis]
MLATGTDSDGGITNVVSIGNTLPAWALLQPNGNIVVRQNQQPIQGTYDFVIRTTDAQGFTTDSPINLRINGQSPTIVPLPVELVYFTAVVRNNQVELEWLTASEQNNDRFEIERSLDAKKFEKVGSVSGKGTTSLKSKYQFTDRTQVQGTIYYRLKQIDSDGEFAYSKVLAVSAKSLANETSISVYPNPVSDQLNVTISVPITQDVEISLYDINGRKVIRKSHELKTGINNLKIPIQHLQSGLYILKITSIDSESAIRILKN